MLPDWKDVTDFRDAMMYYLGRSEQRPQFRRFTYAEKAEYWALVWGMFVMASTGLMAWFKVGVASRSAAGGWTLPLTIHWYEAILATLAIIVWHIYSVIFDPDAYPMNWAWYDGKMSIEHTSTNIRWIRGAGQSQGSEPDSAETAEQGSRSAATSRVGRITAWNSSAAGQCSTVAEPPALRIHAANPVR